MVNTVTTYRSPVRLVKHTAEDIDSYSSQAISRARKKMMAEIALAGDEVIIDDVSYSRNDAATLLDVITEEAWKTHSIIYKYRGLLDFLEKETFNDEELKKADAYLYNTAFVQAVSPYFAHSFNTLSGKLLRQDNFEELVKLLNYQGYILPEHSHEAYQKIRTYLDELSYTLRNLSWEKFSADESILHFIFSDEWKRFLNKLPSSFTATRDEIVEQVTGIVLRFQHKATWYYLHQVLLQLKAIETNDFNRSEVERIDKVIYDNSRIEGQKGVRRTVSDDGEVSTGRIIWWVIWIILLIVRLATCNDRSSRNSGGFDQTSFDRYIQTQNASTDEMRNEPLLLNFMDSLSQEKGLPLTSEQSAMKTGSQPFISFADDFPTYGEDTVQIANNTNYHCVVLFNEGSSRPGSVYEGALPKIAAVYIKKGDTYTFRHSAGDGKFYFLFGERWGKLKEQADLPVYSERGYSNSEGRKHIVMLYEFFSNSKPIKQKYLQQAVFVQKASSDRDEKIFNYLNNPYDAALNAATEIKLVEKKNTFSIEAKGSLLVKEERQSGTFSTENKSN